jgi:transposase
MARAYSLDLRERVVASVAGGESCRAAAKKFKVSVASVVKWYQRFRATGSAAAKPMGAPRGRRLPDKERGWILARVTAMPDLALRAVVLELQERGVAVSYGSVWRIVHDAGLSFKKNAVRRRARSPRRRAKAGKVEALPGPI